MSKIDEIVNGYASNELTYIDREGEHKINIDEFIKTGSTNVLQKLNRTEQVLLKVANAAPEKLKWVNDYAMMKVIDKLYEKVDDLSAGLIEKDTEIERLNNEATASRVAFETADGIPKEEAEKLVQRIEGMEADEQIHLSQIDQLIKERDEALEHESIAIKQMETKTDEYATLEERFNKSVEAYKTLKAENTELNNKLTNRSADMDSQYNELATKYNSVKEELESLQSEASIVTDRHNQLVQEYDKLNVEYNAKVAETITLKDQLDTNANDMGHEIDVLNTRLDNIMEENEKLTNKIAELQQMKTDLEQELNSYAGEFEKVSARCQEIDSRNEELNLEYEKQKDLTTKLEEQYNSACEELNNLKESFGEATGQIRNLDSTNVELQNKINEQESLINGLQETINSITNERTELQNNLEEKNKENALLNAKIRNSEDMNSKVQKFENAINDFLNVIGWSEKTSEHVNKSSDNTQHRMGDNQVVNFNMGM